MPDDHSKVAPLLPIPNRTVKRLCADDSADSRVKVGHRQALTAPNTPSVFDLGGFGFLGGQLLLGSEVGVPASIHTHIPAAISVHASKVADRLGSW